MKELTQDLLKELLHYDPDTGVFTWKERPLSMFKTLASCNSWNARFANKQAGGLANGYIQICINSRMYHAHRVAWIYIKGSWPEEDIDAIDGRFFNLKFKNLRKASLSESNHKKIRVNRPVAQGVYASGKKFMSMICADKKQIYLGTFNTPEEAHSAYVEAKRKISPEFCML